MLTFLKVKDFAIIDELHIEFEEGLSVITGETGAGKSIIINALSTLMNAKAPADVVRTSAPQAEVSGHFVYKGEEYVVKRVIGHSGRSRAFLNDDLISLGRLEGTGRKLVNIYGQNEFQHLLNKENYVAIIDNLLSLTEERTALVEKVAALRRVKAEADARTREAEGREKEMSLLEFQIDEIERAALEEGEEEEIRERLKLLKDAERIRNALAIITDGLYLGDQSAHAAARGAAGLLKPFLNLEIIEKLKGRIESLAFEIEDIEADIKAVEKTANFDPAELELQESRLSHIFQLKNKYGKTVRDVTAFGEAAGKRLSCLSTLTENIEALEKERLLLSGEVDERAAALSEKRKAGVGVIERAITGELALLSMGGVRFEIAVTDKGAIDEEGRDEIELLISTNPGEPLKPLRRIASGGELSRIMLAMKRVIGGEEGMTLIFDEVDAGIGGRVADMVGRRLKNLAKTHQIVCITHLPQIAVYGDQHYLVEKEQSPKGAKTGVRRLSRGDRVSEVARMMGGASITEKTLQRAEEMLHNAEKGID